MKQKHSGKKEICRTDLIHVPESLKFDCDDNQCNGISPGTRSSADYIGGQEPHACRSRSTDYFAFE